MLPLSGDVKIYPISPEEEIILTVIERKSNGPREDFSVQQVDYSRYGSSFL
jgi:hypothetical protein